MTKLATAIQNPGDNASLILIGPPGTGKTLVGAIDFCISQPGGLCWLDTCDLPIPTLPIITMLPSCHVDASIMPIYHCQTANRHPYSHMLA